MCICFRTVLVQSVVLSGTKLLQFLVLLAVVVGWVLCVSEVTYAQKNFRADWEDEVIPDGRFILRWGLLEGQKLKVDISQDTLTTTKRGLIDSGEVPLQLTILQDWVVESVHPKPDDKKDDKKNKMRTATVLQTFRQLKVDFTYPSVGKISLDTNQPAPESLIGKQIHRNLMTWVGRQTRMEITKLGQIKSLKAVESEAQPAPASSDAVGQMFSPQQLRNIFAQVAVFEIYSLAPGDEWSVPHEVSGKFPAKLNLKYSLKGLVDDQKIGLVEIAPTLSLTKEDLPIVIKDQSGTGEIRYSFELMQVLETKLHQELQLEIKGDDPADPPLLQTIKTDTRVKFQLEEPAANTATEDSKALKNEAEVNEATTTANK